MNHDDKKPLHDALDDKFRALSTFARGAAHDLNNILTGISGNISLALDYVSPDTAALKHKLEDAEKAMLKAKDFITAMVAVTEAPQPILMPTRLDGLIESAVAVTTNASKNNCDVMARAGLSQVMIDSQCVEKALISIIDNALKATPEGGRIKISAEEITLDDSSGLPLTNGDYVTITVSDDGPGIPPEALPRIFEPYFTNGRRAKGLGLSSAYTIVRANGGYITASSVLGHGTTIKIYLPAIKDKSAGAGPREANLIPEHAEKRLLIISAQGILADILRELLTSQGFSIELAPTASGASKLMLEKCEAKKRFDLILFEFGDETLKDDCERLSSILDANPGIKIITTLPASTDALTGEAINSLGAVAVLRRPYDVPKLIEAITKAVGT